MDARLVAHTTFSDVRLALRNTDTWPGCEGVPLGKAGYWVGDDRHHRHVGRGTWALATAVEVIGHYPVTWDCARAEKRHAEATRIGKVRAERVGEGAWIEIG